MSDLFGLDRPAPHDEELELLTTAYDNAYLAVVESILNDAEIPYLKKDRGSGSAMKMIMGYSMFGCDIFVRREDIETASALVAPPADSDDTDDADALDVEEEDEAFAEDEE